MNLPNKLTAARFVLALFLFALVWAMGRPECSEHRPALGGIAFALFVIAAITDTLDGWIARRYSMITEFGRVFDPLTDKVIICGCLVLLSDVEGLREAIAPWMIVAILVREFMVTALRGFAESKGVDFMSIFMGKLKMVLQCVTVGAALFYVAALDGQIWARTLVAVLMWASVLITIGSGILYFPKARRLMAEEKNL
jgi:CDP-diacylglycerol---glycerol-3-phosphate 3-phosphatidyltransferase